MKIEQTAIPGVVIIHPRMFSDDRGYFFESYNRGKFNSLIRDIDFCQDNESKSSYGVVRALHFQIGDYSQSKLVRVIEGRVLDVAVDVRKGSPTFGKHVAVELSAENHLQLFIPRGFAHGFSVLSPTVIFQYKCDRFYAPGHEGCIAWNDPDLGIDWGVPADKVIVSERDSRNPLLKDCDCLFDYSIDLYK
jgi:dTDP-4-dehydrorhamnose 3,5-epimerase